MFGASKLDSKELSHATTNSSSLSVNKIFNKKKIATKTVFGLCLRCGRNYHFAKEWRSSSKLKCNLCAKLGHVTKVCITSLLADSPNAGPKNKLSTHEYSTNQVRNDNSEFGTYKILDIYHNDY